MRHRWPFGAHGARRPASGHSPVMTGSFPPLERWAAHGLVDSSYNCQVASLPTLVVVSGPIGAGKTTLAHQLARAVGCPAICRDEIKEGMACSTPGFVPAPGDELTMRTLPVFFGVLELLLRAGVTTIADAAFQDHVWRPRLEPFRDLAHLRVVHCVVSHEVAFRRVLQRGQDNPVRRAHADRRRDHDVTDFARHRGAFNRVLVEAPWIEVDTADGYKPGLDEIVRFVSSPAEEQSNGREPSG